MSSLTLHAFLCGEEQAEKGPSGYPEHVVRRHYFHILGFEEEHDKATEKMLPRFYSTVAPLMLAMLAIAAIPGATACMYDTECIARHGEGWTCDGIGCVAPASDTVECNTLGTSDDCIHHGCMWNDMDGMQWCSADDGMNDGMDDGVDDGMDDGMDYCMFDGDCSDGQRCDVSNGICVDGGMDDGDDADGDDADPGDPAIEAALQALEASVTELAASLVRVQENFDTSVAPLETRLVALEEVGTAATFF